MNIRTRLSREWIQQEYVARRAKNPGLSLRSFARFLRIPPSRLSEILSGKRPITVQTGIKIAERLGYGPETRNEFMKCVVEDYRRSSRRRRAVPTQTPDSTHEYHQLSADAFYAIADWYHFAILSLTETQGFRSDPKWISDQLGITLSEVNVAIERLIRLGLLRAEAGRLEKTQGALTTTHEIRSVALRRGHRQLLEKAIAAIEEVDLEKRDVTSMTMAIDPGKLTEAKALITDFRRKLAAYLETGKRKEVYILCVQLIPLTQEGGKE